MSGGTEGSAAWEQKRREDNQISFQISALNFIHDLIQAHYAHRNTLVIMVNYESDIYTVVGFSCQRNWKWMDSHGLVELVDKSQVQGELS